MKQRRIATLLQASLCTWLVSVSVPARADLIKNWESPLNNQEISGIQQFRGFAYSTTSTQPLSVKLMVTSPQGMNLESGQSFRNVIAKSTEDGTRLRINPGNSTASYLYQKVIGGNISGARMPLGCSGSICLSDTDVNTLEKLD